MKEELTTAMHSEFIVSDIIDKQNRSFTALSILNGDINSVDLDWVCVIYEVSNADLKNNLNKWISMNKITKKNKKEGKY